MSKVDHPRHYNQGKIEVIDVIEDWDLGFHDGNVVKYVLRAKFKDNEIQDSQDKKSSKKNKDNEKDKLY